MTERKPQVFEVALAQVWRDGQIDVLAGEGVCILFKTQFFEPELELGHQSSSPLICIFT